MQRLRANRWPGDIDIQRMRELHDLLFRCWFWSGQAYDEATFSAANGSVCSPEGGLPLFSVSGNELQYIEERNVKQICSGHSQLSASARNLLRLQYTRGG